MVVKDDVFIKDKVPISSLNDALAIINGFQQELKFLSNIYLNWSLFDWRSIGIYKTKFFLSTN